MPLLTLCRIRLPRGLERASYPFTLPLIAKTKEIAFTSPVTFFVGENGAGKSTIIEGIAAAAALPTVGAHAVNADPTLAPAKRLSRAMTLSWERNTHKGFFLRAEDFFGFTHRLRDLRKNLIDEREAFNKELDGYGRQLAVGTMEGQIAEIEARYGEDLDAQSHGESFLTLFGARLVPNGLYLLDEPEVPLSPQRQLTLLSLMKEMVGKGAQFIIATHSPILMAFPDATILSFDTSPPASIAYEDVPHVTLTREFLAEPGRYLRHL